MKIRKDDHGLLKRSIIGPIEHYNYIQFRQDREAARRIKTPRRITKFGSGGRSTKQQSSNSLSPRGKGISSNTVRGRPESNQSNTELKSRDSDSHAPSKRRSSRHSVNFKDVPTIVQDNLHAAVNIDSPRKQMQSLISEQDYALEEDKSINDSMLSIEDKDPLTVRRFRAQ
jgi:hypothetical protein